MMFRHVFYKAGTATMAPLRKLQTFKGFSRKVEMAGESDQSITRVLFCGPHFPASQVYTREYVENNPVIKVDDVPLDDVPRVIGNYDICVVKTMPLKADLISRASRMKLIMQYGVGLEGVDVNAATEHGIKVARIPGSATGNAASCAEMAIYLMLGLLRKQNEMQIAVKHKKLGEPIGETLFGKTVFIMGFGNIGIDLAKRLRPFGVKILATKRSWESYSQKSFKSDGLPTQNDTSDDLVDEKGAHEHIQNFASNADIVVCCLSMNSQTAGIVNKTFLSSMKKGALLVNVARGGLLDYEAVLFYLTSGHLGGLGMDVAWTEPFDPDDPILKFPNVLITPHVAGVTEHAYRFMAKVVGDVALQLHAGAPLTGIEFVN
ncbi:uncharacterized protein LOC131317744 isoform X1 [Rhododendron vialii]|uniref:uncharacterized protein LOC131317744 isoform X1 n=2 Tax=Rhododendron vialii TaxID=182163 RepID=UPI002660030D|nr:uncharacterized protein LOC131317744 isoform X1 [Rhododendron vialii]XP_058203314.1 uncharacterized protein LOC131317744 isoform X1 [Rhododendron vialii]XP_058203315.1 uncharacterized protein LOC131317744 isoform X1 [Rhododendron vialii]